MFCGVDEAGRGSVMGPLVVGSVYAEDDTILKEIRVKDSKKLTEKTRERMYDEIISACPTYKVVIINAKEIDEKRKKISLNEIEMDMFVEAVSLTKVDTVYADCPDPNEMMFSSAMSVRLGNIEVIGRHKADDTYPIVSASSIIAKVTRDRVIADIQKEYGFDIGSGYPSDRETMDFIEKWIKENGCPPEHTRSTWEPVKRLMSISRNTKLTDW